MDKETREFVKLCSCSEVQKGWEPKVGDRYFGYRVLNAVVHADVLLENKPIYKDELIFLPSLEQIIGAIGERFVKLTKKGCWVRGRDTIIGCFSSSPRIACLKALLAIRKEGK